MREVIQLSTEILRSVRTFLGPRVEARAQRRSNETALAHRITELQLEREAARIAERERDYSLGYSGRLRQHRRPGLAPCLLVSPNEWETGSVSDVVANTVSDRLGAVDPQGMFLQVITGGFSRDGQRLRTIGGAVRAAELADQEFSPGPSMVVYFEGSADALFAKMLLTHVLPTINGDSSLTMPLARLAGDGLHFAMWHKIGVGDADVEWVFKRTGTTQSSRASALGSAIAAFAVAVTSVYWQLQGVRWRLADPVAPSVAAERGYAGLLDSSPVVSEDAHEQAAFTERLELFTERLEQEFAGLIVADLSPELCVLPDGGVGLYLDLVASSMLFALDEGYPRKPPRVFIRHAGGKVESVRLDCSQWQPSNSIVQLAHALR
jgi:hypothetical protein